MEAEPEEKEVMGAAEDAAVIEARNKDPIYATWDPVAAAKLYCKTFKENYSVNNKTTYSVAKEEDCLKATIDLLE